MLFLLIAGLLHAALLRNGDILAPYAILGFALLAARRQSARRLVVAAILLALLPYAIKLGLGSPAGNFPTDRARGRIRQSLPLLDGELRLASILVLDEPAPLVASHSHSHAGRSLGATRGRDGASGCRLSSGSTDIRFSLPIAVAARIALILLPGRRDPHHWTLARRIVLNELYYAASWSLAAVYVAASRCFANGPLGLNGCIGSELWGAWRLPII